MEYGMSEQTEAIRSETLGATQTDTERQSAVATWVVLTALKVVFAPVVIPYYVTKASINVALYPARAVYAAVTENGGDNEIIRTAYRTVKHVWNTSRPYVEVILKLVGNTDMVYQVDIQVKKLTGGEAEDETAMALFKEERPPHLVVGTIAALGDLPTPKSHAVDDDHESFVPDLTSEKGDWDLRDEEVSIHSMPMTPRSTAAANKTSARVRIYSKHLNPRGAVIYLERDAICYNFENKFQALKGARKLRFDAIKAVHPGKRPEVFSKEMAKEVPEHRCLSILAEKSVAVEFTSLMARDTFTELLHEYMQAAPASPRPASPKRATATATAAPAFDVTGNSAPDPVESS